MSDEPVVSDGKKTILVGTDRIEVTDPNQLMPVSADLLTEIRLNGNVVALSFASFVNDGGGPPEARICSRVRITLESLAGIQTAVQNLIADAAKAREAAN